MTANRKRLLKSLFNWPWGSKHTAAQTPPAADLDGRPSNVAPTTRSESTDTSGSLCSHTQIGHQTLYGERFFSHPTSVTIETAHMIDVSNNSKGPKGVNGLKLLQRQMATSALHNSKERFDPPKCDEDTRVGLLDEISEWTKNSNPSPYPSSSMTNSTRILCLTGPAGSGKSALFQTMTERHSESQTLLASFFFCAADRRRNTTEHLVPTLAYQIAQSIGDATKDAIYKAVEDDPTIFERTVETQLKVLVVEPLRRTLPGMLDPFQGPPATLPRTIFIDGIDECQGEEHQTRLLRVLGWLIEDQQVPWFRLCFSSRPEFAVRTAVSEGGHLKTSGWLYHIELSEHDATGDIRCFLERRLANIFRASQEALAVAGTPTSSPTRPGSRSQLFQWPSKEAIETLVCNSSGQFIYAATVVKFLSDRRRSPVQRLQTILTWTPGVANREKPFAMLDTLYANIFVSAERAYNQMDYYVDEAGSEFNDTLDSHSSEQTQVVSGLPGHISIVGYLQIIQQFTIQGYVTTVPDLESFLSLEHGTINRGILSDLHSLVKTLHANKDLPESLHIAFHHKSVSDFLGDRARCGEALWVSRGSTWSVLSAFAARWVAGAGADELKDVFEKKEGHSQLLFISLSFWASYLEHCMNASDTEQRDLDALAGLLAELTEQEAWTKLLECIQASSFWNPAFSGDEGGTTKTRGHSFWVGNEHSTVCEWISPLRRFLKGCDTRGLSARPEWARHLTHLRNFMGVLELFRDEWGKPVATQKVVFSEVRTKADPGLT